MSDEIILYTSPEGNKRVAVYYQGETVWLTQKQLAELYNVDRSVITKHPGNIFSGGELKEGSVSAIFAHTAEDGKTYQTGFYNLDAIIAVGYRVNSHEATRFRSSGIKSLSMLTIIKNLYRLQIHNGESY